MDAPTDTTAAPAKILSITEVKNGSIFVATEAKIYQLLDGKLRPLIFADVEHAAVLDGATPVSVGAAPAAPPPPAPPKPVAPASPAEATPSGPVPPPLFGGA
jgi:hypothetical protein